MSLITILPGDPLLIFYTIYRIIFISEKCKFGRTASEFVIAVYYIFVWKCPFESQRSLNRLLGDIR